MSALEQLREAAELQNSTGEGTSSDGPASTTQHLEFEIRGRDGSTTVLADETITDEVSEAGLVQTRRHSLYQASCCGRLLSFHGEANYEPPAARCPSCQAWLCRQHPAVYSCCYCHQPLCRACRRVAFHLQGLVFCAEHYEQAEELISDNGEWIQENRRTLASAGFVEGA